MISEKIKINYILTSCIIMNLSLMVRTITIPSLPAIANALNASQEIIISSITAFLLGMGISQLLFGVLSDIVGTRKVIFYSLIICLIANLLSTMANSGWYFWCTRLLVGISVGACPVVSRIFIKHNYDGIRLTKAFNFLSVSTIISPALSTFIGGYLQINYDWRAPLNFLSLYIVLCMVFSFYYIKNSYQLPRKKQAFFRHFVKDYSKLLINKTFVIYCLISTIVFAYNIIWSMIMPFILQQELNISEMVNSYIYIIIAISYFLGSIILDKSLAKVSEDFLLMLGVTLFIANDILKLIYLYFQKASVQVIIISITITAFSSAIIMPIINKHAITCAGNLSGSSSAFLGFSRSIGTFGLALCVNYINSIIGLSIFQALAALTLLVLYGLAKKLV